jgi:hypothetical protein
MNNEEELFRKISLIVKEKSELSKLYSDLNNAINSSNIQSIWALSKVITRYHFEIHTD